RAVTIFPLDRKRLECLTSLPVVVSNDGNPRLRRWIESLRERDGRLTTILIWINDDDRVHTWHVLDRVEVIALQTPAVNRRLQKRGVEHVRQDDVNAENSLTGHDGSVMHLAGRQMPKDGPLGLGLQFRLLIEHDASRSLGDRSVRKRVPRNGVGQN